MTHEDKSGSQFIVDLGTIKLPRLVEKQVEAEIQAAVLRALAESDFGGDQQARNRIPIWDQFPGATLGLWSGDPDKPPIVGFPSGGFEPLTVRDHTLIMRAVMEHPLPVLRSLPDKHKLKGGRPSGKQVLQAALQVEQIDGYVKGRIQAVLDFLPKIEEGQAALPEPLKRAVDGLRQQLANKTFEEKCSVFRDAGLRSRHREDGLAEGMEVAAQILEDGQGSIYSPDHSFYKLLQEGQGSSSRPTARPLTGGDIADADGIGAAAGGAVGSLAGGVGAGPGAVAGGAGASAGVAIVAVISWLF